MKVFVADMFKKVTGGYTEGEDNQTQGGEP